VNVQTVGLLLYIFI